MEKQIENILIKVDEGTMPVQQALSELLDLFAVSGSLLDDKWEQYRNITNNEDAWCFKEWLKCNDR
jgi:hypothetical protein